ncbi:32714_t:CDS:2, partial [Gigaspora margarita]
FQFNDQTEETLIYSLKAMSNRTSLLVDYSEKLENDLKDSNIENFNYSQFSKPERIGSGGYAV